MDRAGDPTSAKIRRIILGSFAGSSGPSPPPGDIGEAMPLRSPLADMIRSRVRPRFAPKRVRSKCHGRLRLCTQRQEVRIQKLAARAGTGQLPCLREC